MRLFGRKKKAIMDYEWKIDRKCKHCGFINNIFGIDIGKLKKIDITPGAWTKYFEKKYACSNCGKSNTNKTKMQVCFETKMTVYEATDDFWRRVRPGIIISSAIKISEYPSILKEHLERFSENPIKIQIFRIKCFASNLEYWSNIKKFVEKKELSKASYNQHAMNMIKKEISMYLDLFKVPVDILKKMFKTHQEFLEFMKKYNYLKRVVNKYSKENMIKKRLS